MFVCFFIAAAARNVEGPPSESICPFLAFLGEILSVLFLKNINKISVEIQLLIWYNFTPKWTSGGRTIDWFRKYFRALRRGNLTTKPRPLAGYAPIMAFDAGNAVSRSLKMMDQFYVSVILVIVLIICAKNSCKSFILYAFCHYCLCKCLPTSCFENRAT